MSEVNINYKGTKIAGMDASGTKTLLTSGKYCEGDISVEYTQPSAPAPSLQSKTKSYTPSVTAQSETVTADSGYDGLAAVDVSVAAISPQRTSANATVYEDQVSVPYGWYPTAFIKTVASGTAGTPTATKGSVSNHSVSVTPKVTNTEGYISGGPKTGTAVTVSASELVSGSETKTENGTYDVTNLASLIVNVAGGGGSGKEFETGTYSPTSDIAHPTISFTNTHSEAPVLVAMVDQSSTAYSNNSSVACVIFYPALLFGTGYVYQNTTKRDLVAYYSYKGSSSSLSAAGTHVVSTSVSTWVSKTGFSPYTNSTSRYWRSGRTYKWIAIWK